MDDFWSVKSTGAEVCSGFVSSAGLEFSLSYKMYSQFLMSFHCNSTHLFENVRASLSVVSVFSVWLVPTVHLIQTRNCSYSGLYVVAEIKSSHLVTLRDKSTGKLFKNSVHLDRLNIAYVRAPNPGNFFLPRVTTDDKDRQDVLYLSFRSSLYDWFRRFI
jgi:hypothetical protein